MAALAPKRRRSSSVPPRSHDINDEHDHPEEPAMTLRELISVVEELEYLQDLVRLFHGLSCRSCW